jgi:hypothetical protein
MAGLVPAIHERKTWMPGTRAGHDGTKYIAIARLVVPLAILYDMYHLK